MHVGFQEIKEEKAYCPALHLLDTNYVNLRTGVVHTSKAHVLHYIAKCFSKGAGLPEKNVFLVDNSEHNKMNLRERGGDLSVPKYQFISAEALNHKGSSKSDQIIRDQLAQWLMKTISLRVVCRLCEIVMARETALDNQKEQVSKLLLTYQDEHQALEKDLPTFISNYLTGRLDEYLDQHPSVFSCFFRTRNLKRRIAMDCIRVLRDTTELGQVQDTINQYKIENEKLRGCFGSDELTEVFDSAVKLILGQATYSGSVEMTIRAQAAL